MTQDDQRWWDLGQQLGRIEGHAAATNGNIAEAKLKIEEIQSELRTSQHQQDERIGVLTSHVQQRQQFCPLLDKAIDDVHRDVETARANLSAGIAEARAIREIPWKRVTFLLAALIVTLIGFILRFHGADVLKFFGG